MNAAKYEAGLLVLATVWIERSQKPQFASPCRNTRRETFVFVMKRDVQLDHVIRRGVPRGFDLEFRVGTLTGTTLAALAADGKVDQFRRVFILSQSNKVIDGLYGIRCKIMFISEFDSLICWEPNCKNLGIHK